MRVQTAPRAQIFEEFKVQCQVRAANDARGFRKEFEELEEVGRDLPTRTGELEANREKNRYPFILPYDHCRVRLSVQNSFPNSDYINGSFVPGGESERDFICTQGPLANTTADFWRMVWEQNVRIIVMVTALRHKDTILCDKYWPLESVSVFHGLIQVTTVSRKPGPDCVITTINIRHISCQAHRTITHYCYASWPDRGVPKFLSLCGFTEYVRLHLKASPRLGPAVVHCSAGVGRSGTFVALLWLMQLCVRGIRPDVKAAVEDLRLHRMRMVQNLEQYIFVHRCLLHWLTGGTSLGSPQTQGVSISAHDRPQSSSGRGDRRRHRRHRHTSEQQQPPQTLPQTVPHVLRRILPSFSQLNLNPHNNY